MPCRATQDGRFPVEGSDKMWSTGEQNGKPLQYSSLEKPTNNMKRQEARTLKDELPRSVGDHMLLEIRREINPERMKRQTQSKNNTQLLMWKLVMEVKSNAIKNNIAWEPEMLGSWIEVNWKRSNRRCQE